MRTKSIRGKLLILVAVVFIFQLVSSGYFLIHLSGGHADVKKAMSLYRSSRATAAAVKTPLTAGNDAQPKAAGAATAKDEVAGTLATLALRHSQLQTGVVAALMILTLGLAVGAYWIIRALMQSVHNPAVILNSLVLGNTAVHVPPAGDELSGLVNSANQLTENLKQSSTFAQSIGEGNFNFDFKPVSDQDMLGNSLVQMREKLKTIAETDKKRNWSTEGLAMFSDLIRKSEDQKALADTLVSELVKYTKASQGGLFIVNRDNERDLYLELIACYAYGRKKFLTKRIEMGTGLLGQSYLEGQTVYLTKVPQNYTAISSGLGDGTPGSVLIVPLKLNEITEGVIELASFKPFETHEIEFVQRVGESIASAISNSRISEQTKKMLAESQQQSEEMRSQEEEMRQNMEEMHATQEAMERQAVEMKKMHSSLELEKSMFSVLMEFLPDRITYKDTGSRIMRINKAKAERLNMKPEAVVGKTDYDFFSREHAEKAMREEKALIDSGKPLIDIEERLTFSNGDTAWVSTSRIPFRNEYNKVTGMFIITKDITRSKIAELSLNDRDAIIQRLFKALPVLHYKVNLERNIIEAWAGKLNASAPDAATMAGKALKDVFPVVDQYISAGHAADPDAASADADFMHYIFGDSVQPGLYWVYAVAR